MSFKRFENKNVVDSFQPFKVSGPDGLHPFFYQKYWNIIGPSVKNLVHEILINAKIPPTINQTYICLIPKLKNANSLRNFLPIGLCNTIYIIISKIIVIRMKPYLQKNH